MIIDDLPSRRIFVRVLQNGVSGNPTKKKHNMSSTLLHASFIIIILIFAFVAIRQVGALFFKGSRRADVAAAFIVIAFGLGLLVGERKEGQGQAGVPVTAVVPSKPALVGALEPKSRDVSMECVSGRPPLGGGVGNVDSIARQADSKVLPWGQALDPAIPYTIVGWAVAPSRKSVAVAACLIIDGHTLGGVASQYGTPRPDVATSLQNDATRDSGFAITIPANALRPGTHNMQIAAKSSDGSLLVVTGGHELVVR